MPEKNLAFQKSLTPEAQRALAEAAERREVAKDKAIETDKEHGGPRGEEPTRFGDWERKGIVYDF